MTTMFIPYSGWHKLIENILDFRGNRVKEAQDFSKVGMDRQRIEDRAIRAVVVLELGLIGVGIWTWAAQVQLHMLGNILSSVVVGAGLTFLVAKRERLSPLAVEALKGPLVLAKLALRTGARLMHRG